ncbi:MAG: methyltransferase domain-containing protein [Thermomicrobiales bacterium]|nr:methyltransferase domain-containing protein [Thermomicrobiales bacterium]
MTVPQPSAEEIARRLSEAMRGALDLFSVYIGDQLGFYRLLVSGGPATSMQLAERAGTNERYTREWLEQQAVTGFLAVDDPTKPVTERVFSLPAGYEAVFVDPDSFIGMAQGAQILVGTVKPLPALLEAFRTGAGVPYDAYGPDLAGGQARFNRPMLLHQLAQDYIPVMPDIDARLRADPPARVADIGMGMAWSSIGLARGYPKITVDGFDLDAYSVEQANANVAAEGLRDRVVCHCRDAGDPELAGQYDFALAVECVHDMANPVAVLSAMRRLVGPGGTVLIVDDRADESFLPNGTDQERVLYGFSILHCLPVGMGDSTSAQTGAVMRPDTFRGYAAEAGFSKVEILPVEHEGFSFYRLTA